MEFIHSVLAQNEAVVAGTVVSYDLPVNPLSHIMLTLKFAQNKALEALDMDNVDAMIAKVEVLYKGSAIYSSNGSDLVAVGGMICGFEPWTQNAGGVDDDERAYTFIIPLGRRPFDPKECFPRSTRGELILQITYRAAFVDIDTVRAQIETIELPDAMPERYLRITTLTATPTAIGEYDMELPIGHVISNVIFWGTTKPAGDLDTATLQYGQLLIDNQRRYYSHVNYESWRNLAAIRQRPLTAHAYHHHQSQAAVYAQWQFTSSVLYRNDWLCQHVMWEFDPLRDGTYLLDTKGASDVVARIYAGVANALRVLPCELIRSSEGV